MHLYASAMQLHACDPAPLHWRKSYNQFYWPIGTKGKIRKQEMSQKGVKQSVVVVVFRCQVYSSELQNVADISV